MIDPVTLGTVATAIGGVGKIASAFGFGGKGTSFKDMGAQLELQRAHSYSQARNLPKEQRLGWERAGIHPVYAMGGGASMGSGSSSIIADEPSRDWAQAGAGIERAMNAGKDTMTRLQEKLMATQIKGAELDNEARSFELNSRIAQTTGAGTAPAFPNDRVKMTPDEQTMSKRGDKGTSAGSHPFWMDAADFGDYTMKIPRGDNPAESMESVLGAAMAVPQMLGNRWKYYNKKLDDKFFQWLERR